jgi:hypothetical protein
MNWREFSSSLIGSAAWPIIALIIVLIFREPIKHLLLGTPNVKRWKAGPFEWEYWDRTTSSARHELERVKEAQQADISPRRQDSLAFHREMRELAKVQPTAAVLESYDRIEQALKDVLSQHGHRAELAGASASELAEMATRRGYIKPETANTVQGLTVLRNLAAHAPSSDGLNVQRALEFVNLAEAVLYTIRSAR